MTEYPSFHGGPSEFESRHLFQAGVVELAYTAVLETAAVRYGGSKPLTGTKLNVRQAL